MSFLPPLRVKRGLTLGFTVLTLSLGCSSFSAQGGTMGVGGAGAGSGGASGSVSLGGHGGQPRCDLVECFVANTCLDQCGGKVVYVGCCACDPPSVSQFSCAGGR